MKVLHTADWHIGSFRGPEKDGENLRYQDTLRCLEEMVEVAKEEKPDLVLVSGDIFDNQAIGQTRGHKEVHAAFKIIRSLSECSGEVIVMRGTPNHDNAGAFSSLADDFDLVGNIHIVTIPWIIHTEKAEVAILPGFDRGTFRAKHPELSKEAENEAISEELRNIVGGLKAQCEPGKKSILMSHYTIPGCNAESGQIMMLTQFEPVLPPDILNAAGFDLIAMGHIHRPQKLNNVPNCFYSGAINAMNFNDEGQERGFWIHDETPDGWNSTFHKTSYREFITLNLTDADITALNSGDIDTVANIYWRQDNAVNGKIVRILYTCSQENQKALNVAAFEKALYEDGAFYIWEMLKIGDEEINKTFLSEASDPEENLRKYLEEKQFPEEKIQELILKARPIIAAAEAGISSAGTAGKFEPVEIAVKNYRNYEEETFNFENITFCTINGQNGAGKSSLFMDAIVDCIYEEPREGEVHGWIRSDESARSGSIMFTFRLGEKTFRITRTRSKAKKATLNLSEMMDGEWVDRSEEKMRDTQDKIIDILGMDSLTFKACAIIMQDQYGLFLQTNKKDRMAILGNLLGLGIYEAMNKIAAEKAKQNGGIKNDLEQEIKIHEATIAELGNPAELVEERKATLDKKTAEISSITRDRDAKNLELLSLQDAQERCNKISEAITTLTAKKASTEAGRASQESIISSCETVLKTEQTVIEKANRYRELESRRKELIEATALFSTKQTEVSRLNSQVVSITADLEKVRKNLFDEQDRLAVYEDTTGDEEILRKAEEYKALKPELDDLRNKAVEYQKAVQKVKEAESAKTATQKEIEALERDIQSKRSFLGKDIALLSSDCGCIDIEKANCKFLEKARASQSVLLEEEDTYRAKRAALDEQLVKDDEAITAACDARSNIDYDPEHEKDVEAKCSSLFQFVDKAEHVKRKAGEATLIKANIDNLKSKLADLESRLISSNSDYDKANAELEQYRGAFDEDQKVKQEMDILSPWIEQEKQLPVIRERLTNATQRISELDLQLADQTRELAEKQAELSQELIKTSGFKEKQEEVDRLNDWLSSVEREAKTIQMEIGALMQRAEQIEKLKAEIGAIQEKVNEAALETADYDALKLAFSQDGIPHQITRTIVPKLEGTANNILGQMTGGKMGVTFKTEKILDSGKEKVALDIFIEEFGKSALPYISKSGGEKVKASLSVILALAEIKSTTAGIQLGMLFIDEPPFLDADGIQAYCDALETIQRRYSGIKIMAITHDPTMKARFPQNLDVIKTEQGSKVIYQ